MRLAGSRAGSLVLVPALIVMVGCSIPQASEAVLTVFAAASLREAFEDMALVYQQETNVRLSLAFDASSALRTQIEQGAPADVFASADLRNAEALAAAGLTEAAPVAFAGNQLVIIVPADNPAGIRSPADLAEPRLRIVAAGDNVPITQYALQAVQNLAAIEGYPSGFADAYAANIVSREDNVRAVATRIELGEGDAAIVYATDAVVSGEAVRTIELPAEANVRATYAAVAVRSSPRLQDARAFMGWLTGSEGQRILGRHGFTSSP